MTSSDTHVPATPDGEPPRKSVLFCPGCGHESPVDGDWTRRTDAGVDRYECPDCETTVTARPRPGAADGDHPATGPGARTVASPDLSPDLLRTWTRLSASWLGLWRRWTRPAGCD